MFQQGRDWRSFVSGGTHHSIPVLKDLNGISKRTEALPSQGARALVEFLSVGCSEVSGTERCIIWSRLPFPPKAGADDLLRYLPTWAVLWFCTSDLRLFQVRNSGKDWLPRSDCQLNNFLFFFFLRSIGLVHLCRPKNALLKEEML